jgi:hypothetical protein
MVHEKELAYPGHVVLHNSQAHTPAPTRGPRVVAVPGGACCTSWPNPSVRSHRAFCFSDQAATTRHCRERIRSRKCIKSRPPQILRFPSATKAGASLPRENSQPNRQNQGRHKSPSHPSSNPHPSRRLQPADPITHGRTLLVAGCARLSKQSSCRAPPTPHATHDLPRAAPPL